MFFLPLLCGHLGAVLWLEDLEAIKQKKKLQREVGKKENVHLTPAYLLPVPFEQQNAERQLRPFFPGVLIHSSAQHYRVRGAIWPALGFSGLYGQSGSFRTIVADGVLGTSILVVNTASCFI